VSVDVRGPATLDTLAEVVVPRSFVLCDCEGAEEVLLNPVKIPALASCDLIVEVHEHASTGIRERLRERFAATHDVEWIPANLHKQPPRAIAALAPDDQALAVREHRLEGCDWLILTSRKSV
jgi:hypothetical protein